MYSQLAFVVSMIVVETLYSILCGTAVCSLLVLSDYSTLLQLIFHTSFNLTADRAGFQFLIIMIDEFFSVTLGQAVAAITPNAFVASLLNPFIIILFSLFCGVMIPAPSIPKFWRSWMHQLDLSRDLSVE
jgi:ABC-type multidrug transport system permease subunit